MRVRHALRAVEVSLRGGAERRSTRLREVVPLPRAADSPERMPPGPWTHPTRTLPVSPSCSLTARLAEQRLANLCRLGARLDWRLLCNLARVLWADEGVDELGALEVLDALRTRAPRRGGERWACTTAVAAAVSDPAPFRTARPPWCGGRCPSRCAGSRPPRASRCRPCGQARASGRGRASVSAHSARVLGPPCRAAVQSTAKKVWARRRAAAQHAWPLRICCCRREAMLVSVSSALLSF